MSLKSLLSYALLLAAAISHPARAQSGDGAASTASNGCTQGNAFENPAFETGDLTGWTAALDTGADVNGEVVEDAEYGGYYYEVATTNSWGYIEQAVSGLDLSQTYYPSVEYKLVVDGEPEVEALVQFCVLGWSQSTWSNFIGRDYITPSSYGSNPDWSYLSTSWQPTAESESVFFIWNCQTSDVTLSLDNFELSVAVCPSSTATTTTTTTATLSLSSRTPVLSSSAVSSQYVSLPLASPSSTLSSSSAVTSTSTSILSSSASMRASSSTSSSPSSLQVLSSVGSRTLVYSGSSSKTLGSGSMVTIPAQQTTPPPLTTSTVLSTRTSTVTACPSAQPNCPARSRTTSVMTETVIAYTTVCPVSPIKGDHPFPTETTSSIFSTRTETITRCPRHMEHCPLPQRKTSVITEIVLVSTSVLPVQPTYIITHNITHTAHVTETRTAFVTVCPAP
ncbi:hypothetical protein N7462_002147 [Penicillium macrosclerotiorum]|uniref:uncharacterized protein n=1 Tax=Penicillium macrosclerotiorum TaxID=303699 RepID=UPI0025481E08|nr:uncharacterized protein N7462_002147 [Penicillium macrosclerotiorum]KAJ5692724.1 hypothetical protein N7462_002147 [Penicillium macrosclerotiorum]